MTTFSRRAFLEVSGASASLMGARSDGLFSEAAVAVAGLMANSLREPLGLEERRPRLSWRLEGLGRKVRHTAYRIWVASTEEGLRAGRADLWDSGKVQARKSRGIEYDGTRLASRQRCYWRVQVWDENDRASDLSAPSWWETGLLEESDWAVEWLAVEDSISRADRETGFTWIWGPTASEKNSQKFRFHFELPAAASSGELVAVANDWYSRVQITQIWLDGRPIAGPGEWVDLAAKRDEFLSLVQLRKELPRLSAGNHLIAIEVTTRTSGTLAPSTEPGAPPAFALFARLALGNDKVLRFGSGTHWKTADSLESGWHTLSFDDTRWSFAQLIGLEGYQPWLAKPAIHLRRAFHLEKQPIQARLYATALGAYEARLNGQRVGDALLSPEPSQYAKRLLYQTYDVTALVHSGGNVLGLTVADGWYASFDGRFAFGPPPRRVLAQLEITFADGSRATLGTGPGWRMAPSPLQSSQIKIGEV